MILILPWVRSKGAQKQGSITAGVELCDEVIVITTDKIRALKLRKNYYFLDNYNWQIKKKAGKRLFEPKC